MPGSSPHGRFVVAYVLLAAALAGAILLLVLEHSSKASQTVPAGQWSSWQPKPEPGLGEAKEILKHVVADYRTPPLKKSLIRGQVGRPTSSQGAELSGVLVVDKQTDLANNVQPKAVLDGGEGLEYLVCSQRSDCAFPDVHVARRAALELALYTFRYTHTVQYVIVDIPGSVAATAPAHLLLRRQDVTAQLDVPLLKTLPQANPSDLSLADSQRVDRLVLPHEYSYAEIDLSGGSSASGSGSSSGALFAVLAPLHADQGL